MECSILVSGRGIRVIATENGSWAAPLYFILSLFLEIVAGS